jgi:hypothetical protein
MIWRQVDAKLAARRGEHASAERLGREALALAAATDMVNQQGNAYADLAEVLELAGEPAAAATALEQAIDHYARKGNLVLHARTEERLTALRQGANLC